MVSAPVCDVCGRVCDMKLITPNVQPSRFSDAIADYDVMLCDECRETKPLREIIAAAQARPGGTVEGNARLPYLMKNT